MALKQAVVWLLVADDVGIGKTIEVALIVRELIDRGEIARLSVLCPPHLCEQWQRELRDRFHIDAVVVRSTAAARLERGLPANQSVFEAYPYTVVSLDYIKSDRRRDEFQRACPECVIVDEAHTCTVSGQGRQQRYTLLRGLAEITYQLTGAWGRLADEVLTYARALVERAEGQGALRQRMSWWAALALLRCISSSPAAAVNALRTRLADGVLGEGADEAQSLDEAEAQGRERILVATDCLSEGINLQHLFSAAVHYELSWNPTRHEQREGRVDRFGQQVREIRTTMLFGRDNPVDGAVLHVILRKAESIRKELGVLVPMPDDEGKLTQALVGAVLLRKGSVATASRQPSLDFGQPAVAIETARQSARERAARKRTLFAQRRLKPEDVLPEGQKTLAVLGGEDDVARSVRRATARLGAPLEVTTGAAPPATGNCTPAA
ncbi:MAG: RNA polymerase-associated protein RapA [Accumulibacter sp.]|uniref:SNF2-related protein n=1 Tax=Accumulibacter sp. TaxID=2053492 RepID=UPI001212140F|nr:SNF2-related protein [Accumulibacter sp.]TLD45547.1 MAG: RNA polymerase-associated protein RapA [Accumulibacter sp.]